MVLQGLLVDLLSRYLENVERDSIKIDLLQGECRLKNCVVKRDAFKDLGLPFQVTCFEITALKVVLDWKWTRLEFHAQGVRVSLAPYTDDEDQTFSYERAIQAILQKKRKLVETSLQNEKEDRSFLGKFFAKLLVSAQVKLEDVEIEFVDPYHVYDGVGLRFKAEAMTLDNQDSDEGLVINKMVCLEQFKLEMFEQNQENDEEGGSSLFDPYSLRISMTADADHGTILQIMSEEPLILHNVSARTLRVLSSRLSSWLFFEQWVEDYHNPFPRSPKQRWGWALDAVRKHCCRGNSYYTQIGPLYISKRMATDTENHKSWLDQFELDCPVSVLIKLNKQIRDVQAKEERTRRRQTQFTTWTSWLSDQMNSAPNASQQEDDMLSLDGDALLLVRQIMVCRLETIRVTLVDDEHDFPIATCDFQLSCLYHKDEAAQEEEFKFHLDRFHIQDNDKTPIARLRQSILASTDNEFFDAEEEAEDNNIIKNDRDLQSDSPIRLLMNRAAHATTLTVEPLELYWRPDTLGPLAELGVQTLDMLATTLIKFEKRSQFGAKKAKKEEQKLKVRFGAPCIAFLGKHDEISTMVDLGHFELENQQISLRGTNLFVVDDSKTSSREFHSKLLAGDIMVGPIDGQGVFTSTLFRFGLNGDTPMTIRLSRKSIRATHCILSALMETKQYMSSKLSLGSPRLGVGIEKLVDIGFGSLRVELFQKESRLALVALRSGSLKAELDIIGQIRTLQCEMKDFSLLGEDEMLIHDCSVSARFQKQHNVLKLATDKQIRVKWIPTIMLNLVGAIVENQEKTYDEFSSYVLTQSRAAFKGYSSTPVSRPSCQFEVDLRGGFHVSLYKEWRQNSKKMLGEISLSKFTSTFHVAHQFSFAGDVGAVAVFDGRGEQLFASPSLITVRLSPERELAISCVDPLKITYWQPFFMELQDYISNGIIAVLAYSATEALSNTSQWTKFNLSTKLIQILLPTSLDQGSTHFQLDVQGISCSNELLYDATAEGVQVFLKEPRFSMIRESNPMTILNYRNGIQLNIERPYQGHEGLDETLITLNLSNVRVHLHDSLQQLIELMNNNLANNVDLFQAILFTSESEQSSSSERKVKYWEKLVESKSRPSSTKVCINHIIISLDENDATPPIEVQEFSMSLTSALVPDCSNFQHSNEYMVQGLRIGEFLGSSADFPWVYRDMNHSTMQLGVQANFNPYTSTWTLGVTMDHVRICLVDLTQIIDMVRNHIAKLGSSKGKLAAGRASDNQKNMVVDLNLEMIDTRVLVVEHSSSDDLNESSSCVEVICSAVGEAKSSFSAGKDGKKQLDEGNIHLDTQIMFHEGEETPSFLKRHAREKVMMMTMTKSMLFADGINHGETNNTDAGQAIIMKPFTFDLIWDVPFHQKDLTRQFRVVQTSSCYIYITLATLRLFQNFATSMSNVFVENDDDEEDEDDKVNRPWKDHQVTFHCPPLGLKLGPAQENSMLEVRGFAKQCEETVTKRIRMGDAIIEVNGRSMEALSPDQVKDALREDVWPKHIRFRRWMDKVNPIDPLEYTPVAQTFWMCRICRTIQPFQRKGEATELFCELCGGHHFDVLNNNDKQASQAEMDMVEEEIFENQRFYLLVGWSASLLPTDPFPWSDRSGTEKKLSPSEREDGDSKASFVIDGKEWVWYDEKWEIGQDWVYAKNFNRFIRPDQRKLRTKPKKLDSLRRRRYFRRRILASVSKSAKSQHQIVHRHRERMLSNNGTETEEEVVIDQDQYLFMFDNGQHRFSVTFTDGQRNTPLLRCYVDHGTMSWLQCVLSLNGNNSMFRIAGNLHLSVDYLNFRIIEWEPLLEPFVWAMEVQKMDAWNVTLLGLDRANVNVSLGALETLQKVLQNQSDPTEEDSPRVISLGKVENLVGVTFECSLQDGRKMEVEPLQVINLTTLESSYNWNCKQGSISFHFFGGNWKTLAHLHLTHSQRTAYALEKTAENGTSTESSKYSKVVVQYRMDHGCRVMSILSMFQVVNLGDLDVMLQLDPGESAILLGSCAPQMRKPLPILNEVQDRTLRIYLMQTNGEDDDPSSSSLGYVFHLGQLINKVKIWCSQNIAKAVSSGLEIDQFVVPLLDDKLYVRVRVVAEVIEKCFSADRALSTSTKRSIVGARYSTHLVYLELHSPLVVLNQMACDIQIQIRLKASKLVAAKARLGHGDRWNVHSMSEENGKYEWCVKIPYISEQWSVWKSFVRDETYDDIILQDSHGHQTHVSFSFWVHRNKVQQQQGEKYVSPRLVANACYKVIDHTGLSMEIGHDEKEGPLPGQSFVQTVIWYEFQKYTTFNGWHDVDKERVPLDQVEPCSGFKWGEPEWHCNGNWEYSNKMDSLIWVDKVGKFDHYRRRMWRRSSVRKEMSNTSLNFTLLDPLKLDRLIFRVGHGPWCAPPKDFILTKSGKTDFLVTSVTTVESNCIVPLLVHVDRQTKTVSFHNRFRIVNHLNTDLHIEQCDESVSLETDFSPYLHLKKHGGTLNGLYWNREHLGRWIRMGRQCTRMENKTYWTGPIDPTIIDDQVVLFLRRPNDLGRDLIHVEIREMTQEKTIEIIISECQHPVLYRIENRTLHSLKLYQLGRYSENLLPLIIKDRRSCPFGWEEMTETTPPMLRIVDEEDPTRIAVVNLFQGDEVLDMGTGVSTRLQVRVYNEGNTRVVCIAHPWAIVEPPRFLAESVKCNFRLELTHGLTISVVDHFSEILVCHFEDVVTTFALTDTAVKLGTSTSEIQFDDPNNNTNLAHVFHKQQDNSDTYALYFDVSKYVQLRRRFKNVTLGLRPFHVKLGRELFRRLSSFYQQIGTVDHSQQEKHGKHVPSKQPYMCDHVGIGEINALVTLVPKVSSGDAFGDSHQQQQQQQQLLQRYGSSYYSSLSNALEENVDGVDLNTSSPRHQSQKDLLKQVVSSAIARVTDVQYERKLPYWAVALDHLLRGTLHEQPILIKPLTVSFVKFERGKSQQNNPIAVYYQTQIAIQMAATALTTLRLFQQPVNIFRSVSGYLLTQQSNGGSMASFSESMFRGLGKRIAVMSLSNEYIHRRQEQRIEASDSLKGVMTQGMNFVKDGIKEGVVGLVSEPYRGIRDKGTIGLFGGLGKGVIGAAVKPMLGLIDAATLASTTAVGNKTASSQAQEPQGNKGEGRGHLKRRRLPRPMYGKERRLEVFQNEDAIATRLLRELDDGKYKRDSFCGQFKKDDDWYLLTSQRIIYLHSNNKDGEMEDKTDLPKTSVWTMAVTSISSFSVTESADGQIWGVHLRTSNNNSRYIPVGRDKQEALQLRTMIENMAKQIESNVIT